MTRHAVLAALLLAALPAFPAQAVPDQAAPEKVALDEAVPACPAPRAPEFAGGKGFALFVTRQGTMTVSNPLRPLSPETVQVLQVVIRSKLATAYGADLSGLRRGPSPAALEAQNGATIQWAGSPEHLPPTLRILADDGGQVLAELTFKACGDPPKVAEPKPPKPAPVARKAGPKAAKADPSKADPAQDGAKADPARAEAADPAATVPAQRAPRPRREKAAAPESGPARTPGGLMLPQGAIP
ncbi:hypothetical protein FF100_20025 [Methylobacterium terricola]|uniref:Uncharacterized protein n=1 Tax=Methylobacterium terricola TaxID=2583531 RepID=A0A5C4LHD1_9HYPH|nr:hypothetical protein [Methylobacterium terricola]TNC11412.1 hypothetical protein FF100_20025 [Methylobacterium terricola]